MFTRGFIAVIALIAGVAPGAEPMSEKEPSSNLHPNQTNSWCTTCGVTSVAAAMHCVV
eukprot:m.304267 g.304267  ORF g.304267 m.304267 type:complete len:58 (+) comp27316_c0_seq6:642-815(+)